MNAPQDTSGSTPKYKILIVDDHPGIRTMMHDMLVPSGYEVCLASNGLDGLRLVERFKPDLITSDINMPEMNGIEMGEALRQRNITTPILYISDATDRQEIRSQLAAIAATFTLRKPAKPADVRRTINDILDKKVAA